MWQKEQMGIERRSYFLSYPYTCSHSFSIYYLSKVCNKSEKGEGMKEKRDYFQKKDRKVVRDETVNTNENKKAKKKQKTIYIKCPTSMHFFCSA